MATEEITISELELADEVLADMVMAVETASDTKAITLKQLKAYLGSNLPTGFILPAVGRISDERFTLLDGKTLAKSGGYEAFYNKVQSEVEKGNWYACTEDEFNADVSKYGQCGRFVLTAEYVRIPKITRFIGATVTLSEIGKTYAETLPKPSLLADIRNATGTTTVSNDYGLNGTQFITNTFSAGSATSNPKAKVVVNSPDLYQDGAKVQPDHTRYPYYMVVSTEGQSEPISVDINKVYEDIEASLSTKANTDLSNISSNIDYVVESGSNYMKFKSGKLIQWGRNLNVASMGNPIPYKKPFSEVGYVGAFPETTADPTTNVYDISNTDFKVKFSGGGTYNTRWFAIGQGA